MPAAICLVSGRSGTAPLLDRVPGRLDLGQGLHTLVVRHDYAARRELHVVVCDPDDADGELLLEDRVGLGVGGGVGYDVEDVGLFAGDDEPQGQIGSHVSPAVLVEDYSQLVGPKVLVVGDALQLKLAPGEPPLLRSRWSSPPCTRPTSAGVPRGLGGQSTARRHLLVLDIPMRNMGQGLKVGECLPPPQQSPANTDCR